MKEQWNVGQPGGINGPFYSVVSSTGEVIAMQVPSEELAKRIAALPVLTKAATDYILDGPRIETEIEEEYVRVVDLHSTLSRAILAAEGLPE